MFAQERLKTTDTSLLSDADRYCEWKEDVVARITKPTGTDFFLHELDTKVSSLAHGLLKKSLTVMILGVSGSVVQ